MVDRIEDIWDTTEEFYGGSVVIVGVDPGVTTGISLIQFYPEDGIPLPQNVQNWGSAQLSYGGSGNVHDLYQTDGGFVEQKIARRIGELVEGLAQPENENQVFVAIEDFIIRRVDTSRDFLSPVRLTSGILQEIYEYDNVDVVFQSPSDAKGVCTDDRMDKWGYQIRTQKDRHSRDADRHAVLLLRKMLESPSKFGIDIR